MKKRVNLTFTKNGKTHSVEIVGDDKAISRLSREAKDWDGFKMIELSETVID